MKIKFEKYQGLGNDFIFISSFYLNKFSNIAALQEFVAKICHRHFGIGADGVIFFKTTKKTKILILNSDGSFAETCGNALRCLGLKLWRDGAWNGFDALPIFRLVPDKFRDERSDTKRNLYFADRTENDSFAVISHIDYGLLQIETKESIYSKSVSVFFDPPKELYTYEALHLHTLYKKFFKDVIPCPQAVFIQLQNPHLVFYSDAFKEFDTEKYIQFGQAVQKYLDVNVGFLCLQGLPGDNHVLFESSVLLRVYERGAGLTLACGSGAVAASCALQCIHPFNQTVVKQKINIKMPGGLVLVTLPVSGSDKILLSADAAFVFNGVFCFDQKTL